MSTALVVPEVAGPAELIVKKIYVIRGCRAMFDADLAALYGVETKALNRAVKRNLDRFPSDFMFQLTAEEFHAFAQDPLRYQIGTSKAVSAQVGRGGRRYMPYVFTEQGVAMLSSVLSSAPAVQVNIAIMRAFVRLREVLSNQKEFAFRLEDLERKFQDHDGQIGEIFEAIRCLIAAPEQPNRRFGFPE